MPAGRQIHQHGQAAPLGGLPDAGDAATPNLIEAAGGEPFGQVGLGGQPPPYFPGHAAVAIGEILQEDMLDEAAQRCIISPPRAQVLGTGRAPGRQKILLLNRDQFSN